jgi:flagellar hook-length control protein FliK
VPGAVSADTYVAAGDGSAIPGPTGPAGPEATTVGPAPLGEPVISAPATADPAHPVAAEVTPASVPGPPTVAGVGVVPVPTGAVAPAATWANGGTQGTGQPAHPLPAAAYQQVFTAVSPLLRGADGSYGMELQLHPQDLGAVQVTVDVRRGEISIQMNSTDPAARDALRSGLSDLRQQLEDQGLRAGSMEVGSGGANARQPETSWSRSEGADVPRRDRAPSEQLVDTAVAASSTSLDLRM